MNTVLVVGASCLDYVAEVGHFPSPDEKLRTNALTICGGGNAGNTATCLSRLDIPVKLISKIGCDVHGEQILEGYARESNLDTSAFLRQATMPMSPFTYVIVDRQSNTRTCLFSATDEQILVDDVRADWLHGVRFIHFDSRSTEAAVQLAILAERNSIPCSLDLERTRPCLDQLIPRMNYIISNDRYSREVCHDAAPSDTAVRLLRTYPHTCRFVIITRGKHGSILVERADGTVDAQRTESTSESLVTRETLRLNGEEFHLWKCTAWPILSAEITDTTGSGDAFIGGVIYALLSKESWSKDRLLRFASYIAMCKLKGVGARSSLPHLSEIDMQQFL